MVKTAKVNLFAIFAVFMLTALWAGCSSFVWPDVSQSQQGGLSVIEKENASAAEQEGASGTEQKDSAGSGEAEGKDTPGADTSGSGNGIPYSW
jgi:hypothetical protein